MNPPTYEQLTHLIVEFGDTLRNQEVRNEDEINQVIGALQTTLHILVMSKQQPMKNPYTHDPHNEGIAECISRANMYTWHLIMNLQPYTIDNFTIEDNINEVSSYLEKIRSTYEELKRLEE